MMASKRHDPPLFRDADGDEAHEFWEETVPGRGDMARNTNVHEAWRRLRLVLDGGWDNLKWGIWISSSYLVFSFRSWCQTGSRNRVV